MRQLREEADTYNLLSVLSLLHRPALLPGKAGKAVAGSEGTGVVVLAREAFSPSTGESPFIPRLGSFSLAPF